MHEYSIVSALVDRVQHEVDARPGAVVRKLHVSIGECAGVEVELLRTAWETFRDRTSCEHAELAIDRVAAVWCCPTCGTPIRPPQRCGSCFRAAHLAAGDEIILERIEMEVSDV